MPSNRTAITLITTALVLTLAPGCRKKPPVDTGATMGEVEPDTGTERVPMDPTPRTPAISDSDINQGERVDLGDIYFDFDQYEIRGDQRPTLEKNAQALLSRRGWKVSIEGHCDERGTEEYNLALGDRRAHAVSRYLQTLGVPAERVSTISYGKAYPADPGHDERAWAKNRRAHFVLVAPAR